MKCGSQQSLQSSEYLLLRHPMVFPCRICHLVDNNNEGEDIRIISWPFKLIINYLLSSSLAVVSLQTDTWQYPGPSSTSLSAPLALSSAGSWRSTFSLVSSQPSQPSEPSSDFSLFPVLVSAPVFFAWSDGRHQAEIFNGSAQVSRVEFPTASWFMTINNLMSARFSFYFWILGKECSSLIWPSHWKKEFFWCQSQSFLRNWKFSVLQFSLGQMMADGVGEPEPVKK